jgi:hypothetical protein
MITPIYIVNRNRYTSTKNLVDWLIDVGETDITILDNESTYPPVLEYYATLKVAKVQYMLENAGPYVLWDRRMHHSIHVPYIVTDSDVVPSECCPKDLIAKMHTLLNEYPAYKKVGPGLRVDNIPDNFPWKDLMLLHQFMYWQNKIGMCFEAKIDTTFAIYRPGLVMANSSDPALRMDIPYVADHVPWTKYPFDEEEKYYQAHAVGWSTLVSHMRGPIPTNNLIDKWDTADKVETKMSCAKCGDEVQVNTEHVCN